MDRSTPKPGGLVDVSVIIATRGGPTDRTPTGGRDGGSPDLGALVRRLCGGTVRPTEVFICVDGPMVSRREAWCDEAEAAGSDAGVRVEVVCAPAGAMSGGPGATRNRGLERASGELVLLLNDDVVPAADLVERHVAAQRAAAHGRPALIVGAAPWGVREADGGLEACGDRVIDRLVRETSLVFFYDRMADGPADRDWGARHAWTLNLSVRRAIAEPFDERLRYPMFDDLEWADRIVRTHGARVLYEPTAVAEHRHWYEPVQLLEREALLGHQALALEAASPELAGTIAGGSLVRARLDEHRRALPARTALGREAFAAFRKIAKEPSGSVDARGIETLFAACRPWREAARSIGVLAAAAGRDAAAARAEAVEAIAGAGGAAVRRIA
jgi:hypothetical protein